MKKIILILILFLTSELFTQNGNLNDFLPLQTGNIWVYQCSTNGLYCGFCSGRTRINLTGDSVINGKTYYKSLTTSRVTSGSCPSCGNALILPFGTVRVDSETANVFQTSTTGCQYSPGEIMLDSFKARLNDSIRINCQPPGQWFAYICSDTGIINIFGSARQSRLYTHNGFESGYSRRYAKGIGLYSAASTSLEGGTYICIRQMTLAGCVINGIVYGDTSMLVSIRQISTEIPKQFSLFQNYPNPFNPVTKIKFTLPGSSAALIVVYDAAGREIETIFNGQLNAGIYEADWNAENFSSGVYYYKLTAGNPSSGTGQVFTETRKMVLLK